MYDPKQHKALIERVRNINQSHEGELLICLLEQCLGKCQEDMIVATGEETFRMQGAARELRDLIRQLKRTNENRKSGEDGQYRQSIARCE